MRQNRSLLFLALVASVAVLQGAAAQETPFTRIPEVIYGRKDGMALTMDIFKPAKPSGIGVLVMCSGGWHSNQPGPNPTFAPDFLKRGQTVFAVTHGSAPKYTMPEIFQDITRAVRFVRAHAAEYGVDPNRLAITGGSSGGHISLMAAATGADGNPQAADPVERASSRLQAVACLCPPTDFVNYGAPNVNVLTVENMKRFWPTVAAESDEPADQAAAAKAASPLAFMTKEMPPTLLIHGDADLLVPIQQSQEVMARLQELGVTHQLIVRPGKGHGWKGFESEWAVIAAWFDQQLARK